MMLEEDDLRVRARTARDDQHRVTGQPPEAADLIGDHDLGAHSLDEIADVEAEPLFRHEPRDEREVGLRVLDAEVARRVTPRDFEGVRDTMLAEKLPNDLDRRHLAKNATCPSILELQQLAHHD